MESLSDRWERELNQAVASFWRNYERKTRPVEDVKEGERTVPILTLRERKRAS